MTLLVPIQRIEANEDGNALLITFKSNDHLKYLMALKAYETAVAKTENIAFIQLDNILTVAAINHNLTAKSILETLINTAGFRFNPIESSEILNSCSTNSIRNQLDFIPLLPLDSTTASPAESPRSFANLSPVTPDDQNLETQFTFDEDMQPSPRNPYSPWSNEPACEEKRQTPPSSSFSVN